MPKKINLIVLTLISFLFIQSHLLVAQSVQREWFMWPNDYILENTLVHSMFADESNSLWAATDEGIYIRNHFAGNNVVQTCVPPIPTYLVADAPNGQVLFVTHRNEVIILDKQKVINAYRYIYLKGKIVEDFNFRFLKNLKVSNLAFPKDLENFWIASRGDGLWKKAGQEFTKVEIQKKDSPEDISDILLFDDNLWVAATEGLYYTEDISTTNKSHKFIQVSSFSKANKMVVYQNQLWILGLDEDSESTLKSTKDGKNWTTYPIPKFFEYQQVPSLMAFDGKGNLWVASDRIAKFEVFGDKSWTEYKEQDRVHGKKILSLTIMKNHISTSVTEPGQYIWVGTDIGNLSAFVFKKVNEQESPKTETAVVSTEKVEAEKIKEVEDLSTLLKTETIEDIKGKQFQLKVQFKTAKSTILPQYEDELNEIVSYMKKNTELLVSIQGHTAPIGDAQKNQKLSEERANEVKKYLLEQGISGERIKTYGYGDTQPLTTNTNQMSQNMRVEIMFYSVD